METFQLPLREIEARFTKSELGIVAWSSQEQSFLLRQKIKQPARQEGSNGGGGRNRKIPPGTVVPEGLPDRFFNEEGELDQRLMTGPEAWRYMTMQGVNLPYIPVDRMKDEK